MNEFFRRILFLPLQRSTIAKDIDTLHYFVISVTLAGSVLVFLMATVFVIRYRRRPSPEVPPPNVHATEHYPAVLYELSVLVGLLLLFLVWWVIGSRQYLRLRVAPENALEVYVTGKQWMWRFAYPNGKRGISTLYVPAHRPIKLIMTSRDVIHSFYVPEFRIKQDVIPGRYTTEWFEATEPGTYQILCAEYCGTAHSEMRGDVVALEPDAYERWLEDKSAPPGEAGAGEATAAESAPGTADLVAEGKRAAAELGCFRCHTIDGSAFIGPTWAGIYGSTVALESGGQTFVDAEYITESMMDPLAKIVRGYQPRMPSYFGRVTPTETADIVELIKSLRDVPRQGPGGSDPGQVLSGKVPQ
jgi:cytochrome c oxidase subunit 2